MLSELEQHSSVDALSDAIYNCNLNSDTESNPHSIVQHDPELDCDTLTFLHLVANTKHDANVERVRRQRYGRQLCSQQWTFLEL